jgi:WhiB family transcriptional regulator, redox-sensing transcriptional regulator
VARIRDDICQGDWRDRGRCLGRSDLFFAAPAERPQARERRERVATMLCSGCTVRRECRDFGREHGEYGFWGGENESARVAAGFYLAAPLGIRRQRPQSVTQVSDQRVSRLECATQ